MIRKLQKVGKSRALIISKELAGLIGLGDDEEVIVEVFGSTIYVRPASSPRSSDGSERERWSHTPLTRQESNRIPASESVKAVRALDLDPSDTNAKRKRRSKQ
jgi:antitoxin component of MazEF toxin-antitoxin module